MAETLYAVKNTEAILAAVEDSLQTIPQAKDYEDLWIRDVTPHPSVERIQHEERLAKPTSQLLLHEALVSSGFSQAFLDKYQYRVSKPNPFFVNYESGEFHTLEAFAKGLTDGDSMTQLQLAIMLGFNLIESQIRSIAYGFYPMLQGDERSAYWRMIMSKSVIEFAQVQRGEFRNKKAYQAFKDRVVDLFSEQGLKREGGIIEAVGGKVICRFPGQSRINPEVAIGVHFDEGVVRSLTHEAKKSFTLSLFENDPTDNSQTALESDLSGLLEVSGIQQRAESILDILGLQRYKVRRDKKSVIVDERFEAFAYSKLPRLIHESEDPRLNPFQYVQIVEERDWLRR